MILHEIIGGKERRHSRLSGSELMSCISLVSELRIIRLPGDGGGTSSGAVFAVKLGQPLYIHSGFNLLLHIVLDAVN